MKKNIVTKAALCVACLAPVAGSAGTLEANLMQAPWNSSVNTWGDDWILTTTIAARTEEESHSKSDSYSYTRSLILTYTGTVTDTPPASVKVSYSNSLTANLSIDIQAASPLTTPNESAVASYSVGSSPAYLLQDTTGTINQTYVPIGLIGSSAPLSRGGSNLIYSTPLSSWTATVSGTTVVYTRTIESWWVSGDVSASVSTPKSKTKTSAGAGWADRLLSYTAVSN